MFNSFFNNENLMFNIEKEYARWGFSIFETILPQNIELILLKNDKKVLLNSQIDHKRKKFLLIFELLYFSFFEEQIKEVHIINTDYDLSSKESTFIYNNIINNIPNEYIYDYISKNPKINFATLIYSLSEHMCMPVNIILDKCFDLELEQKL